jgi:hypothetical protein
MERVPLHSPRVQWNKTYSTIALFVFSINRIPQNASHTNLLGLFKLFWYYIKQIMNVPLNGTFHLSPHENILTIALINIHYLYNMPHMPNSSARVNSYVCETGYIILCRLSFNFIGL